MRCQAETSKRRQKLTIVDCRCMRAATIEIRGEFFCEKHAQDMKVKGNEYRELMPHEKTLAAIVHSQIV